MRLLIISIALLMLSGCASSKLSSEDKVAWLTAQSERRTLEIECESACTVSYTDPRDRPALPQETTGADVTIKALGVIGSVATSAIGVAPIYFGAAAAVDIADRIGVNNSVTTIDNSAVDNSAVADPTVITAPNPVIVNPEVITAPDPVIVNPEVIQVDAPITP